MNGTAYQHFSRYWLCAATGPTIKIWDLESKNMVEELRPEVKTFCDVNRAFGTNVMID